MSGKVFISCGQKFDDEKKIAKEVKRILKEEFGLNPYLAFSIQSLEDIMIITRELSSSDYYLFIDFLRETKQAQDLPISLFTHQELALAHHLCFEKTILLKQEGTPAEGFVRYILGNPEPFKDERDLLEKIRFFVRDRGWAHDYSRNLIVTEVGFTDQVWLYSDHTGASSDLIWQIKVENGRSDVAAVGTVCILDRVARSDKTSYESPDRAFLKWARTGSNYERTIIPKDYGIIDLFAIREDTRGLFLHSAKDQVPREPVLTDDGEYVLLYKLYSQGFPAVEFSVELKFEWTSSRFGKAGQRTIARIIKL